MALAIVQVAKNVKGTTGTTLTLTINAPTTGNTLVVIAGNNGSVRINSIDAGTTWSRCTGISSGACDAHIWQNVSGSPTSVVLNLSTTGGYGACIVEISGAATTGELVLAAAQNATQGATTTPVTASITPAASENAVILGGFGRQSGTTSAGPTDGYTGIGSYDYAFTGGYLLETATTGSAYTTSWITSSVGYSSIAVAIGDGGGASPDIEVTPSGVAMTASLGVSGAIGENRTIVLSS